ncbi:MAG: hypothetical protein ACETWT_12570 [Thermodesulfobacteriota bacterium]
MQFLGLSDLVLSGERKIPKKMSAPKYQFLNKPPMGYHLLPRLSTELRLKFHDFLEEIVAPAPIVMCGRRVSKKGLVLPGWDPRENHSMRYPREAARVFSHERYHILVLDTGETKGTKMPLTELKKLRNSVKPQ